MRQMLIMAAALVWATCARADSLTSAIMALDGSDRASDRCDVSAAEKLLHKSYRGTLVSKNKPSDKNAVVRVDKDETLELLDYCARAMPYRSATTRRLHKAELIEQGRVIVSGEFTQESIVNPEKPPAIAYGTFITELACSSLHQCKVLTDTVYLKEVFGENSGKK